MAEDYSHEQPNVAAPEPEPAPIPDYMTDPDAVSKDEGVEWRFGEAPNYSNTRKVWAEGKKANHEAGSIPELVENLVKNWEVEASFKTRLSDWRTIDHDNYTFAMNGEPPQTAEHMLKVGTYNAIITPSEYYCPQHSDFASSHKTFKRMMPTFAWEVLEVYSGPPKVSFKWRHWGVMKNDYVGFNDKGEKVKAKAHGRPIEIFGVTVAAVNEKFQLQNIDTYMDPLQMFRQIAPNGIVNKQPMSRKVDLAEALDVDTEGNEASTMATTAGYTSSGEANGTTLPVTACPVPHFDKMEEKTNAQLATAFTNTHATPVTMELGPSSDAQSSSTVAAGATGSQSSDTLKDESTSSLQLHKSVDTAEACAEGMDTDSGADTASKEDAQNLSHANAGASQDVSMAESGHFNAAAGTDEASEVLGLPTVAQDLSPQVEASGTLAQAQAGVMETSPHTLQSVEKRSFDATQEAGQSTESSTRHGKRVASETTGVEDPMHTSTSFEHGTNFEGQAPTGTQAEVHPHPKDVEEKVKPAEAEAVAAPADSEETKKTLEEMGTITSQEADMMNVE